MWPGLTLQAANKDCPNKVETAMGHMSQTSKGVKSPKPKEQRPTKTSDDGDNQPHVPTNTEMQELHV